MKKTAVKVIVIVLAVTAAVLLAFHITAISVISTEYEGGDDGFSAFSWAEGRYHELDLGAVFAKISYKLFGKVTADGVEKGGEYLFPTTKEPFDYKADAQGELSFTEAEYSAILAELKQRSAVHAEDGAGFYVFVIPNSQTVLRDAVPFGDKTSKTRAEKLKEYLSENGFEDFYILSDAFEDPAYDVFHNTENAINGYGAYLCFEYIVSLMPEQINRRMNAIAADEDDISVVFTDGRALAEKAGIEKMIKNKTVVFNTERLEKTFDTTVARGLTLCTLKKEYNGFIGASCVLVESYDTYEKNLIKPFFAAAYTNVGFKDDLSYSKAAAELLSPAAVVCLVREDELNVLLEPYDGKTYSSKLDTPEGEATETPTPVCAVGMTEDSVLIAGECEGDSEIFIRSGEDTFTVNGRCGRFFAVVPASSEEKDVRLTAKLQNKSESEAAYMTVSAAKPLTSEVYVGRASMLYYSHTVRDFTGANLYSASHLAMIKRNFEKHRDGIRRNTGKNTKIIILAAPDPLTVYPEAATAELYEKRAEKTRIDQLTELFADSEGIIFLDIRENMINNTDVGKLYYQTDTHWTELGAYFGYRAIVRTVSADFPAVSPILPKSFVTEEITAQAGDLASFMGLRGFTENIEVIRPLVPLTAKGVPQKPDTIDRSVFAQAFTSVCDTEGLPSAVMVRDSYSANLFPLINEHFSTLYAQSMWEAEPDAGKVSEIKPDYVIIVCSERNFDSYLK